MIPHKNVKSQKISESWDRFLVGSES